MTGRVRHYLRGGLLRHRAISSILHWSRRAGRGIYLPDLAHRYGGKVRFKTATTCRFLLEAPPLSNVGRSGTGHHGGPESVNRAVRVESFAHSSSSSVDLSTFFVCSWPLGLFAVDENWRPPSSLARGPFSHDRETVRHAYRSVSSNWRTRRCVLAWLDVPRSTIPHAKTCILFVIQFSMFASCAGCNLNKCIPARIGNDRLRILTEGNVYA